MPIEVLEADADCVGLSDEGVLLADGFEDAFIGVARRFGWSEDVAVYDLEKCLQILVDRDGMDREGADEFFEFNVLGAWVGDQTPVFIQGISLEALIQSD